MITRLSAGLAAGLFVLGAAVNAPAASAATAAPATVAATACSDQLTVLRNDVIAVPIAGGKVEKERAGLVKLVDDATALVAVGKPADAIVKLRNLQTKVEELAAAARISVESAALLTADIDAGSGCLSSM